MDHTLLSRLTTPPLTTMGYDTSAVTQATIQSIISRLDKEGISEQRTEAQIQLIEGGTA